MASILPVGFMAHQKGHEDFSEQSYNGTVLRLSIDQQCRTWSVLSQGNLGHAKRQCCRLIFRTSAWSSRRRDRRNNWASKWGNRMKKFNLSSEAWARCLMLTPITIYLLALTLYPFLANVWNSGQALDLVDPFKTGYVGFENYAEVIGRAAFLKSVFLTFALVACSLTIQLVLGAIVALALWNPIRGHRLFTTILILPFGLTPVALALAWRLILNPAGGALNTILESIGLSGQNWTASPALALPSLIAVDVWQWTPFVILIFLAGLSAIPKDPIEAAEMEGAGYWDVCRYVVIPMLKPLILVVVLFRSIDLFRSFDTIWVITGGGPGNATETLNMLLYRIAFQNLNFGEASALALMLLIVILLWTQPFLKRLIGKFN